MGSLITALLASLVHGAASTCTGVPNASLSACCTAGCGQSRAACDETADVCNGIRKGDQTTKANCCPSAIRAANVPCSAETTTSCVLQPSPPGAAPPPLPIPCTTRLAPGTDSYSKDGSVVECASWCKATSSTHCSWCKCRGCPYCTGPPLPPPSPPPISPPHVPCADGALSADGTTCCKLGCGQSRAQCSESPDVCHGVRKGDQTTKSNCCPSTIRSERRMCGPTQGAPCVLQPTSTEPSPAAASPPPPPPDMGLVNGSHPLATALCATGAASGHVCCTAGCGQSRQQCTETADVCSGHHRGDSTTRSNCCPSAITQAGVPCSAARGPPCVLPPPGGAPWLTDIGGASFISPESASVVAKAAVSTAAAALPSSGLPATSDCEGALNPTGTCGQWCKDSHAGVHCRSCACKPCGFCAADESSHAGSGGGSGGGGSGGGGHSANPNHVEGAACTPKTKEDATHATCEKWCLSKHATSHCPLCRCKTCSFCSPPAPPAQGGMTPSTALPRAAAPPPLAVASPPPPPTTTTTTAEHLARTNGGGSDEEDGWDVPTGGEGAAAAAKAAGGGAVSPKEDRKNAKKADKAESKRASPPPPPPRHSPPPPPAASPPPPPEPPPEPLLGGDAVTVVAGFVLILNLFGLLLYLLRCHRKADSPLGMPKSTRRKDYDKVAHAEESDDDDDGALDEYLPREDYQQGLAAINGCAAASPSDPATPCRASNAADAARDGLPPVSPPVASLSGRSALDIRRQVEATREPLPPIAPIPRPESGGGRSMLD